MKHDGLYIALASIVGVADGLLVGLAVPGPAAIPAASITTLLVFFGVLWAFVRVERWWKSRG